jgi:hypothetical protein
VHTIFGVGWSVPVAGKAEPAAGTLDYRAGVRGQNAVAEGSMPRNRAGWECELGLEGGRGSDVGTWSQGLVKSGPPVGPRLEHGGWGLEAREVGGPGQSQAGAYANLSASSPTRSAEIRRNGGRAMAK